MKALPKRKGNDHVAQGFRNGASRLNESPSEKEGKSISTGPVSREVPRLNESPSEKEGKSKSLGFVS